MRNRFEPPSPAENQRLLAEVVAVIREMPAREHFSQQLPDVLPWLGRAAAVLERWDLTKLGRIGLPLGEIQSLNAQTFNGGFSSLVALLHQARHDLTLEIGGPVNVVVQTGMVFDYFEGIRRLIKLAKTDLFFVDPYLDAGFVANYLPLAAPSVSIRLLAREKLRALLAAVGHYSMQFKRPIEVRSSAGFPDRYVFVDRKSCYQSGASFKDGAKSSPTTVTEITDACAAVMETYERLWSAARVERICGNTIFGGIG